MLLLLLVLLLLLLLPLPLLSPEWLADDKKNLVLVILIDNCLQRILVTYIAHFYSTHQSSIIILACMYWKMHKVLNANPLDTEYKFVIVKIFVEFDLKHPRCEYLNSSAICSSKRWKRKLLFLLHMI